MDNKQDTYQVQGFFERIEGMEAIGWVWDKSQPKLKLTVNLIVNKQKIATGLADLVRADLAEAGIGGGSHGFRIKLPDEFFLISGEQEVTPQVLVNNAVFFLKPLQVQVEKKIIHGRIDSIIGGVIKGWSYYPDNLDKAVTVELRENNQGLVQATANISGSESEKHGYVLQISDALFDDKVHRFEIWSLEENILLHSTALILPSIETPGTVLQENCQSHVRNHWLPYANLRYENVIQQLENIVNKEISKKLSKDATELITEFQSILDNYNQVKIGIFNSDKQFKEISFSAVSKPKVSIIIPVFNNFSVTYNCLASIHLANVLVSYEIIIVDDCSNDQTIEIAEIIKGIEYIRNDTNKGFVESCNAGAKQAKGEYVVFLNNDTEVFSAWLDELLYVFKANDKAGLVGGKLLYPDGTLQEAGGIVGKSGIPSNYGNKSNPNLPQYNYTRQVDYISGACIMLEKKLWQELGGFDEIYKPAYYEDTDLAFRVREKGLQVIYTPFCQLIHYEGVSNGVDVEKGIKQYQLANAKKFKSRWGKSCIHNGDINHQKDLIKDRNIIYRALVIDAEPPQPDKNAGSYAALIEMKLLQSLGIKCTFVPNDMTFLGHYTENMQRTGIECLYAPFFRNVVDIIEQRGCEFDLIYITRYSVAEKYIDACRLYAPQAKIIFNNADLHFLRELRSSVYQASKKMLKVANKTKEDEMKVIKKVDLVLSYNSSEHAVIESHNDTLKSIKLARCPWVVDVPKRKMPGFKTRKNISFLGGYGHPPNVEAVEYFIANVMPGLKDKHPEIQFNVYGSQLPKKLIDLANDTVNMQGYVEVIDQVYNENKIFIAPLQSGAGIKGKVLGALAYGIPTILSPVAAEGIGLRDGVETLIAKTPDQWIEAIEKLNYDPALWLNISKAGQEYVNTFYSFSAGEKLMAEALENVDIFI